MKNIATTEFDAPPAKVFPWIYESERNLQWLPNLIEAEVLQRYEGGVGSTFRQVYVENGRRMEMEGVVTAYEQDRRVACAITGAAFDLRVDYLLEDLGGRTRLTQHSEILFRGFAMKLMGTLMKPLMRKMAGKQSEAAYARLTECIAREAKVSTEAAPEPDQALSIKPVDGKYASQQLQGSDENGAQ